MATQFTLYGWELSYFTGKTRSYLRYKGIPFVEQPVDALTLTVRIRRRTGAVVMPVVVTPEGEWLQDTSVIIDRLEERFPAQPVLPATPVQRFISCVLECWGDEFWIPFAMHTRWSHAENLALFEQDAGRGMLPGAPAFVQRAAAQWAVREMRNHLPGLGVVPAQAAVLDAWLKTTLDALDAHFREHDFLLGGRPTLGDFGLIGPLYAHLGRDPWSKRELIAPRRHLAAWIERMQRMQPRPAGELLAEDALPATLLPLLQALFREFTPQLEATLAAVQAALPALKPGAMLPRGMGQASWPLGESTFTGARLPYVLWMVQRAQDEFRCMKPGEQQAVRAQLQVLGGERWLDMDIPRLRRHGLRVGPEVGAG